MKIYLHEYCSGECQIYLTRSSGTAPPTPLRHFLNPPLTASLPIITMVALLPSLSISRYFSGRQAVCFSRCDTDGPLRRNKGLYSLIFDDCEGSPLLAYFTPLGSGCCYYKNGSIRMLSDRTGGCLYNEVREEKLKHKEVEERVRLSLMQLFYNFY